MVSRGAAEQKAWSEADFMSRQWRPTGEMVCGIGSLLLEKKASKKSSERISQ